MASKLDTCLDSRVRYQQNKFYRYFKLVSESHPKSTMFAIPRIRDKTEASVINTPTRKESKKACTKFRTRYIPQAMNLSNE